MSGQYGKETDNDNNWMQVLERHYTDLSLDHQDIFFGLCCLNSCLHSLNQTANSILSWCINTGMQFFPIRLSPATDLKRALEDALANHHTDSAFVVSGIGSLVEARLRYAGESTESVLAGPLEILSISGSLSPAGAHLHVSVSDSRGRVYGGHLGYGSIVRTTAEILLALLPNASLTHEHDAVTGYNELVVRHHE